MKVSNEYYEVVVVVAPQDFSEIAADMFTQVGAFAIEERTKGDFIELRSVVSCDLGQLARMLGPGCTVNLERIAKSAVDTWRQFMQPIQVSAVLTIQPAWMSVDMGQEVNSGSTLLIDPVDSFGMGDHPTTILCLQALELQNLTGVDVLDVGCGSGVLSIWADKRGANHVDAIDISSSAVAATKLNAELNNVESLSVGLWDSYNPQKRYGVVVANILAPVLIELAELISNSITSSGVLILSGIRSEQSAKVTACYQRFSTTNIAELDGWQCLTLRKDPQFQV